MAIQTGDPSLDALEENAKNLKMELKMSNARIAEKVKSRTSAKSISNLLAGRHNVGVDTVSAFAEAADVATWQMLVPKLPTDPAARRALSRIVQAFVLLDPDDRADLLSAVRLLAREAGIFNQIFKEDDRGPADRTATKSRHVAGS